MKRIIFTDEAPAPIGPYSQAVLSGDCLYCSGQIAAGCLDGDIIQQTDRVCLNILAVLAAADLRISDVVKTTCFLAHMADFAEFNKVYEQFFYHKPARSCVAVSDLPGGALVEIEALAVRN